MNKYRMAIVFSSVVFLCVSLFLVYTGYSDSRKIAERARITDAKNKVIAERRKAMMDSEKKSAPKNIMDRVGDKVVTAVVPERTYALGMRDLRLGKGMKLSKLRERGTTRVYVFGNKDCGDCGSVSDSFRRELEDNVRTLFVYIDGDRYGRVAKEFKVSEYPYVVVEKETGESDAVVYKKSFKRMSESGKTTAIKEVIKWME